MNLGEAANARLLLLGDRLYRSLELKTKQLQEGNTGGLFCLPLVGNRRKVRPTKKKA